MTFVAFSFVTWVELSMDAGRLSDPRLLLEDCLVIGISAFRRMVVLLLPFVGSVMTFHVDIQFVVVCCEL
jgi:hypothetical protein